jgi:tetratricopeptide (TPR) repeat protein
LKDYQGALEDLDKADVLQPNNAFTLRICGDVKRILKDYHGTLEDLDKADVLEPNDEFTLQARGDVKRIFKDYQKTLATTLRSIVDCKFLKILQVYEGTCSKHVMLKLVNMQQIMIRFLWD